MSKEYGGVPLNVSAMFGGYHTDIVIKVIYQHDQMHFIELRSPNNDTGVGLWLSEEQIMVLIARLQEALKSDETV
jgi:hypothetical protein